MDYNERLAEWSKYIKHTVFRCYRSFQWMTREELEQDLLIVLWRCHGRYPDYEKNHFKNILCHSIKNALADLLRKRKRESVEKIRNIDGYAFDSGNFYGGRRLKLEQKFADVLTTHETGLEFYNIGIKEISDVVDLEDYQKIQTFIKPANKRVSGRGTKPTLRKVKKLLQK